MTDEPSTPNPFEDLNWDAIEQRSIYAGVTNFHIGMPPLVPPVAGIAEAAELLLKPIGPVTFDADLFQHLIDEQARITALYGPRLTSVSGCAALVHWLMRQFPEAAPGATTVNLLGSVALLVDDEVPFDSLRLTYADGTHKDVRVIEPPDEWPGYRWPVPESTYLPPPAQWPPIGYVDLGFLKTGDSIEVPPGVTGVVWTE